LDLGGVSKSTGGELASDCNYCKPERLRVEFRALRRSLLSRSTGEFRMLIAFGRVRWWIATRLRGDGGGGRAMLVTEAAEHPDWHFGSQCFLLAAASSLSMFATSQKPRRKKNHISPLVIVQRERLAHQLETCVT